MNVQHVSLVDDNGIFCFIFEKLAREYKKCKIEVMVFDNGKSALDFYNQGNSLAVYPKIIFVDINMPVLNGWEMLDLLIINKSPIIKKTDFFIVSSSDNDIDVNKSKDYFFVKDYLSKPLDKEQLYSIFDQYLST